MQKYSYVFFGSEPIGPIALEALIAADYVPSFVVDDPKMPLDEQLLIIEEHKPTFLLVVGYGAILKQPLLDTVAGQVLNIHPSLLPLYRGPAPVVQTILDGATETGVTLMEIDAQMDHGPIIAQATQALHGKETPEELYKLLTVKGVDLFLENIDAYVADDGSLALLPQNHFEATFTHFVKKEDGKLDFSKPADVLEREIRAYKGWPRSWTLLDGKRFIIEKAHVSEGKLIIDLVQPENSKVMTVKDYCNGKRISEESLYQQLGLN